jgi:hypothetical protein
LLQLEFDSDVIAQIPVSVTETVIQQQEYHGIFDEMAKKLGKTSDIVELPMMQVTTTKSSSSSSSSSDDAAKSSTAAAAVTTIQNGNDTTTIPKQRQTISSSSLGNQYGGSRCVS